MQISDAKKEFLDLYYQCQPMSRAALIEALFWELDSEEKIANAIKRFRKAKGKALPPWNNHRK